MACKRFLAWAGVLSTLVFGGTAPHAEESPAPQESTDTDKPAEPPKAAAPTKPSFWGDRLALFLSVSGGGAWSDRTIDSSVVTAKIADPDSPVAVSELDLDEVAYGRLSVGWQLPASRGHLLLTVTGYRETSYAFESEGRQALVVTGFGTTGELTAVLYDEPLRWWTVRSANGALRSAYSVPFLVDDAIIYDVEDPRLYEEFQGPTAKDLQNEVQTWDALYQREFGGRRWSGRWSAGARFFAYQGTVPSAAWLNPGDLIGLGFTDGVALHLIPMTQDTSGWGPTGSLEAQIHLFRDRVVLYGHGRLALLYEKLSVDSGPFFTLVQVPSDLTLLPVPAHFTEDREKTAWQVTAEVGARFRIVPGLVAEVGFGQTSFQDSVLVPTDFQIPSRPAEAPYGSSALYNTRDLLFGVLHAGVSFQF